MQQDLTHQLAVLHEQLAQLNLKHERYREVSNISERDDADIETVLGGMELRTKVRLVKDASWDERKCIL